MGVSIGSVEEQSGADRAWPAATSVVICAYTLDRWDDLLGAVASARGQEPAPREVVLVIDHNDALLQRAQAEVVGARVIANTGARGLSGARNTGVEAASGEIVAFLDDDAAAEPGWLSALVAPFADPHVVGTGGGAIPIWSVPRPAWFPDEFGWVVGCSYRGMPVVQAAVRNPIGCNMAFRRAALVEAGASAARSAASGPCPRAAKRPSSASGCVSSGPTIGSSSSRGRASVIGSRPAGTAGPTSGLAAITRAGRRPS